MPTVTIACSSISWASKAIAPLSAPVSPSIRPASNSSARCMAAAVTFRRTIFACTSVLALLQKWSRSKSAGPTAPPKLCRTFPPMPSTLSSKALAFATPSPFRPPVPRPAMLPKQTPISSMLLVSHRRLPLRNLTFAAFVFAAVAVFILPPTFADSPGEALKHQFDAAKSALAANDLAEAEAHYKETIALGLRQLGSLSISEGQFEPATRYLEEALKFQPDDFQLQLNAAIAWFRQGDEQKALQLINTALASRPNDPQAHNTMGRIFLLQGDIPRAIEELKTAVNLKYDLETAYFLGTAYLKARKMSEANELFAKIESNAEDSAALHVLLGRAYTISTLPEPAIVEFRKAIKLDPNYPREHGFLGYAYLDHLGEQAYPQARAEFEKELKINPNQYYFQTLLGIATVALRDFPAAEIALKQAIRLRPDDAPPYLYLGETYTETNRLKDAVEALQKYLKLVHINQDDMREVSRAYYLLGQDLLRLGRTAESKEAQEYRAFAAEILASSYNDLGVMRAKNSQFAEAAEYFKQAAAWNPALPGLDRNWGFATYRAEMYSEAVPPLERELAAHPGDN